MSCAFSRDDFWEWIYGDATPDQARAVETHLEDCAPCRETVAGMRSLVGDLAELPEEAPLETDLPEQIGEYRILRRIGEGAMGLVFEAEQATPQRRVALKVIRGGARVDDFRARLFQREMQALARLNHPAIASIYDAGTTEDGLTYFAMELVEGTPLNQHVYRDGQPLSLRARIELFHRICTAVNYAHQRGLMHRDLKPANILVTRDGDPKILDFGLARATEVDESGSHASEAGRLLGTPAYMSPEQTRAEPDALDGRSDVYTLGVIFYELLTGAFPYDVHGPTLVEIVRRICDDTPPNPHSLNRQIPPDVSTIILKALEKEPTRRYQTVAELEDDVQRYLQRYPILARPPSLRYRVSRYVSRHKLPVALLSTIFVLAVGAAIVFGVLYNKAQLEANKFESINQVLTTMMEAGDPWQRVRQEDVRVTEVLDGLARRIEEELQQQPLVQAALRHTLGRTYWRLGKYEAAEEQLRSSLGTRSERLGDGDLETVRVRNDLGELLYERGRSGESEPLLREALAQRRRLLGDQHALVGETLNSLGLLCKTRGALGEAETMYREALELRRRAAEQDAAADVPRRQLADRYDAVAQTLNNLGALLRTRAAGQGSAEREKRLQEAAGYYTEALQLRSKWLGEDHPETAKMHNNFGKLLVSLQRTDEAEQHFRDALRILLGGLGTRHLYTARAQYNLAEVLAERPAGRAEARQLCQAALAVQRELLPPDHAMTAASQELRDRLGDAP